MEVPDWAGGAGQGMRPAKLVASRFTASLVAALQVAHLLTFMNGMFQSLSDHSLAGALLIALCALLPLLQWRYASPHHCATLFQLLLALVAALETSQTELPSLC